MGKKVLINLSVEMVKEIEMARIILSIKTGEVGK